MTFNQDCEFKLLSKANGDQIFKNNDTIFVKFGSKRNGIVSSWLNGGYSEDLIGVFNHQLTQENIDKLGLSQYSLFSLTLFEPTEQAALTLFL